MKKPPAQWAGGGERIFTEAAEALDLPATDHVMAAMENDRAIVHVLYTPVHDPDPRQSIVYGASLERGADGVLNWSGVRTCLGPFHQFMPEVGP